MTKTGSLHGTRFGVASLKDRSKFNEKFPGELITGGPIAKPPTFSSMCLGPITKSMDDVKLPVDDYEAKKLRRHTWTLGLRSSFEIEDHNIYCPNTSPNIAGMNLERRRSSESSPHEVIEECPSDEEGEEKTTAPIDYMKCKNCSQDKNVNEDIQLDNINYCFNCKHLYQNKNLFGALGAFDQGRRSSWTAGDRRDIQLYRQSSRHSSTRGSISGSIDLPAISEPVTGEANMPVDDEEEREVQQRVQNEVERLIRFKSSSLERRGTIGCEKDFKKMGFLKKLSKTSRSMDLEPNNKSAVRGEKSASPLNIMRTKNTVGTMKKHFMF